jgi:NADPH:quinone reductase-like Zn-dependent oxidoreductase
VLFSENEFSQFGWIRLASKKNNPRMSVTRKLIRFNHTGGADVLRTDEVPLPDPRENEVLVKVEAIGLSRTDVLWREGRYVEDPVFPAQIEYDAAGTYRGRGAKGNWLKGR